MYPAIEVALAAYLDAVQRVFAERRYQVDQNSSIRVLLTDDQLLRGSVEIVEALPEFERLSQVTRDEFLPETEGTAGSDYHARTYLRMSGVYERIFDGDQPNAKEVASDYVRESLAESQTITYIAPLQFVRFAIPVVNCGAFQIQQMEPAHLASMLRQRSRRLFSPSACVDTDLLCQHPLVCVNEQSQRPKLGTLQMSFPTAWATPSGVPRLPSQLRTLALYDWKRAETVPEQFSIRLVAAGGKLILERPRLPLVIASSDSLLEWPESSPDVSDLRTEGQLGMFGYQFQSEPIFEFDEVQAEQFAAFQRELSAIVSGAHTLGKEWMFVDRALDFLWNGFCCEGVEQLLWNVTAIEAALGPEKGNAGLTEVLRSRVAALLGATTAERKELRKRFDAVYETRSRYVHGSADIGHELGPREVIDAREFARRVVLWMLRYLDHIAQGRAGKPAGELTSEHLPAREILLRALDLDIVGRRELADVLALVPDSFPHVAGWLE